MRDRAATPSSGAASLQEFTLCATRTDGRRIDADHQEPRMAPASRQEQHCSIGSDLNTVRLVWEHSVWAGKVSEYRIKGVSKDNVFFGVQAVDKGGSVSVASYPLPLRCVMD